MEDLPQCRHRGLRISEDGWICSSTSIEVLGGIVTRGICRDQCPFIDHDVPDPVQHASRPKANRSSSVRGGVESARVAIDVDASQLAIGMLTAPRPVATLERSLVELRRAGFRQDVHVFAEPGTNARTGDDVFVHRNRAKLGAWRNWCQAARYMLGSTNAPYILMCEDDIQLSICAAASLQHAMQSLPASNWGFASLYSPRHNLKQHLGQSGWLSVKARGLWGALAWCFTRKSLQSVLGSRIANRHIGDRDTDLVVSQAMLSLGLHTFFHSPSLGAHTGAGISSLGHGPFAASAAVGFDADYDEYQLVADSNVSVTPVANPQSRSGARCDGRDTVAAEDKLAAANTSSARNTVSAENSVSAENAVKPGLSGEPHRPIRHSIVRDAAVRVRDDHSVAVVVPNFNCGAYLQRCIESLKRQTIRCEIVVVDDGSTDNSLEQLRRYDGEVRLIRHPNNRGANAARVTGIRKSQSTWVIMADADAVYSPCYVERLLDGSRTSTAVVYCAMRRKFSGTAHEEVVGQQPFDANALWWNNYISMCSLVRRSVLPIDLMERTEYLEDWRLWLHLADQGREFCSVNETLFDAFVRPGGKSLHIGTNPHRRAVEIADLRRPYAQLIGCDQPIEVVIPATDSADLTSECLWHLARYSGLPLHVTYVDNGSQPGTVEQVEAAAELLHLPIEVIRNRKNVGFTRAVNQGIGRSSGRHVLCLNNDCFVGPQCLDRMFAELVNSGTDSRVAAVGPLSGDDSRHSLRNPRLRTAAGITANGSFDYFDALAGFQVLSRQRRGVSDPLLAFFCTLLSRDALRECGHLDDRTPEFRSGLGADDEWCHRVTAAGWQLRMALDAYAVHLGNRTFQRLSMDRRGLQKQALRRLNTLDYAWSQATAH